MTVSFDFHYRKGAFVLEAVASLDQRITGVFGPSGAGKTTLLHLIAGIRSPDRGSLIVDGKTLFDHRRQVDVPLHARSIGVVFQDGLLFPHLSVAQNLRYGERLLPPEQRRFRYEEVAALLELTGLLAQRPHQLSGGEIQRVALGRAILRSPELLLLDEPLASLDRGLKRQILPFLRRIKKETDIPMIYVSHDLGELLQLTDRLLIMDKGHILGQGPFHLLVRDPRVLDLCHDLGMLNVVPLKIREHLQEEGLTLFEPAVTCSNKGFVPWAGPLLNGEVGQIVHTALRPEDIALVARKVRGISMQNQVPGVVEHLMKTPKRILCTIDTGIPLLVEITPHALRQLKLVQGGAIVCLFKAHALNYLD